MSDLLPKIVATAMARSPVYVECRRPDRMAKELRRHLPHHDIIVEERRVVLKSRLSLDRRCGSGPACTSPVQGKATVVCR